jgi:hypothetical protein
MVLAEPDPEQCEAAGTGLHALRPQRCRHDAQVAEERVPDNRLADGRHPLFQCGVPGIAVLGWDIDHAELVADRVQAVDQATQRGPAARQHHDRGLDVGADGGQVLDADLVQVGLPGHADRRQRGRRHPINPLLHPAHRLGRLSSPFDLIGMYPRPGGVVRTLGLRGQQFDVGPQHSDREAPRQERPRIEPAGLGDPIDGGPFHPPA